MVRNKHYWMLALILFPVCAANAGSLNNPKEAKDWLEKMSRATSNLSYEGTFVYRRDNQLTAMQIVHVANDKGQRERIVSLNGLAREVIREDDRVLSIIPNKERRIVDQRRIGRAFSPQSLGSIKGIDKHYHLSLGGEDRVAGKVSRLLVISPRDAYRYGYRVWIDIDNGLLLQSDLVDENGGAMEQVMFTALKILDGSPASIANTISPLPPANESPANSRQFQPPPQWGTWKVGKLPPGFSLVEHYHQLHGEKRAAFEHMIFTDGLASVSVFVETQASDGAPSFTGISKMGAMNAFGTIIDGKQVTVVGEVPLATVQLVGESIIHEKGE